MYLVARGVCPNYLSLQEIKGLREELSTRLNANDTMEIIREKEEQIRGLLEEGLTFCINLISVKLQGNSFL